MAPNSPAAEPGQAVAVDATGSATDRPIGGAPLNSTIAAIAALRARGAAQHDTLRFHQIEALARRLPSQRDALSSRLQDRLDALLHRCAAALAQSNTESERLAEPLILRFPAAAAQIRHCQAEQGPRGLRRLAMQLDVQAALAPLADLVRQMHPTGGAPAPHDNPALPPAPTELKTLRQFRDTWRRLNVAQQLSRSQQQAPENPGPLNSHGLVLRTLQQMQALSPGYLEHFLSRVQALMWLEQAGAAAPAPARAGRRDAGNAKRPSASNKRA